MTKLKRLILLWLVTLALGAQNIDMDQINADEEFRIGVNAFHQGYYNKAILSMERSLALKPENDLVREWLGRSYFQSGYENAALNEWDTLIDSGRAGESLINFRNMVYERRGLLKELKERDPWVELIQLSLNRQGEPLFSRPTSVDASRNGTGGFFAVNFGDNRISRFDANGNMVERYDGGIDNFHNPFDIKVLADGRMLISEYSGDRLALCSRTGMRTMTIGNTGTGEGGLLGPQYIALSGNYFYVTDWGNSRVVKFDYDGNHILDFGEPRGRFGGFRGPSGIAVKDGRVYVADAEEKAVYVFDESGNFKSVLIDRGLDGPEGLTLNDEGDLLIADGRRILHFRFATEALSVIYSLADGESGRIMKTAFDENNNLLVPDFDNNRLSLMTELSTLYGGLFVRINRIETTLFPQVFVDFTVQDRFGNPCVGLDGSNFLVKEEEAYLNMLSSYSRGNDLAVSLLFESSREVLSSKERIKEALKDMLSVKGEEDSFSYMAAGETPYAITEPEGNPLLGLEENWRYDDRAVLDRAMRMAGADLLDDRSRRALFFFTGGVLEPSAFDTYGLVETARFMKNNDILFYPVYTEKDVTRAELEYLASETGGESLYLLREEGLGQVLDQIRTSKNGSYTLSFTSQTNNDFGRVYLPLSIEVNYLKKSGRDELGFFAPLDFSY